MDDNGLTIPAIDAFIEDTRDRIAQMQREPVSVPSLGSRLARLIPPRKSEESSGSLLSLIHGKATIELKMLKMYHEEIVAFGGLLKELIQTQEKRMETKVKLLKQLEGEKKRKEAEIHDVAKASFETGQATQATAAKGRKKAKKDEDKPAHEEK